MCADKAVRAFTNWLPHTQDTRTAGLCLHTNAKHRAQREHDSRNKFCRQQNKFCMHQDLLGRLQALPRELSAKEVKQHIRQPFQVVSASLLQSQVCVYRGISRRACVCARAWACAIAVVVSSCGARSEVFDPKCQ